MRTSRSLVNRALLVAALIGGVAVVPVVMATQASAAVVPVGSGSYRTDRPAGTHGPTNSSGAAVTPKVTERMRGRPVPTNEWWSSMVWNRLGNPYSENMYAHPLTFSAHAGGLGVGYPTTPNVTADQRTYEYLHKTDISVEVDGLNALETRVDGWGDWTVSPLWSGDGRTLRTTIGHGVPYVFAEASGGQARVRFGAGAQVWHRSGPTVGVTVNGHHYALFAPDGAPWSVSPTEATSTARFFSVAALPSPADLAVFARYAFSFITDTRVSWAYNSGTQRLTATYTATTQPRQGSQTGTLHALYRHQWLNTTDTLTGLRYVSPRGQMRVREGTSFTTRARFNGVLPALPLAPDADRSRLRAQIDAALNAADVWNGRNDTYWTGKHLARLANLARIANQIDYTAGRDRLLALVKERIADWLTAGPGETQRLFAYDDEWDTLIGYPASFQSDTELNDHHFHYSYFILAAAIVAQHDPAWASDARYGGMIKTLIKDAQNPDRADTRFPFLRNFDPYAGHSWANGHASFAHGNNQESTSEGMAFSTAAILFGQLSGDTAIRDAGIYLYTTERSAVSQYWFDVDRAVFPAAYPHRTAGIVWGAGGVYGTWWTGNPEEIHGINMLPINGGSLYHAAWPADILDSIAEMRQSNGGPEQEWRDIIWEFLAIADPAQAMRLVNSSSVTPEEGESAAHTYHWISALAAFGTPDHTVTANTPTYAVLSSTGKRTYVAYNPRASAFTARFSDGATLLVPAGSMAWHGPAGSGTDRGSGSTPDPTPDPTPSPSPDPSPSTTTPRDAYRTIEAETYDEQAGTVIGSDGTAGEYVGWIASGDWLAYRDVDFGTASATQFVGRVSSGAGAGISGLVEVRLDSPANPPIGSFAIANTGGWLAWRDVPANTAAITGRHDVYVTFTSGQPADFVNINSFRFAR